MIFHQQRLSTVGLPKRNGFLLHEMRQEKRALITLTPENAFSVYTVESHSQFVHKRHGCPSSVSIEE